MIRFVKLFLLTLVILVTCKSFAGDTVLFAQATSNQQKYEKAVRSGQQAEVLGKILAGAGIMLVIASIPLMIYLDRKKARKRAARQTSDAGRSSTSESPQT